MGGNWRIGYERSPEFLGNYAARDAEISARFWVMFELLYRQERSAICYRRLTVIGFVLLIAISLWVGWR